MHHVSSSAPQTRVRGDALAGVLIALMIAMVIAGVVVFFFVRSTVVTTTTEPSAPVVSQPQIEPATGPIAAETRTNDPATTAETPAETATEPPATSPASDSGVQISGIIRDTSGKPIEGATLEFSAYPLAALEDVSGVFESGISLKPKRIESSLSRSNDSAEVVSTGSANDGYYELFLPTPRPTSRPADDSHVSTPRELYIRVRLEGYLAQSREISALPGDQQRADFVLSPAATITGRVAVAESGLPAVGMKVVAAEGDEDESGFMGMLGSFGGNEATVREDGTFEITGIAPGTYRVSVRNNGTRFMTPPSAHTQTVALTPDQLTAELEFGVEIGGTLTGRVFDRAGAAIPGAEVQILPADFMQAAMQGNFGDMFQLLQDDVETDENGEFQILGVAFGEKHQVVVESEDHARPEPVRFQLTKDQPERHVEIELEVGSSISGVVVDGNGEPVAEVDVKVLPDIGKLLSGGGLDPSGFDIEAETDDAGRFTLEHLRAGEYRITANELGFDFFSGDIDEEPGIAVVEVDGVEHVSGITLVYTPEVTAAEPTGDGVVSGRVFDDLGEPIEGAEVEVTCMSNPMPVTRYAETDDEGNFSFTDLPENISEIEATADGHTAADLELTGSSEGIELVLLRNGSISGRVVPQGDELVSKFRVSFRPYTDPTSDSADLQDTIENMIGAFGDLADWTTGESDGTFTIKDVPVGTVELLARAAGYAESVSAPITIQQPGQQVTGVEIVLIRGGTITGRVVNDAGQPMEGAVVSIRAVSGDANAEMFEKFMPAMFREEKTVTTDDRGRFTFPRLGYAEYEVGAKHGDLAPSPTERIDVSADREYPLRDLIVSAGGVIAGTIIDSEGEPKSGLMVQLLSPEIGMQMANADAEGKFEFASLKPGEYSIMIVDMAALQRGETKIKARHVEITGAETQELEIAYGKGYKLSGKIKGFDSIPFQQSVQVSRPGGPSSADINPMDVAQQMKMVKYLAGMAILKPDGTYVIEDLEPGTYIVEVPVVPDNPLDVSAYETLDRTPLFRKEITIKERDMELDIRVSPR